LMLMRGVLAVIQTGKYLVSIKLANFPQATKHPEFQSL
jgi:hypothetical protein